MDENNPFPNIFRHQEATNYAAGQTVFEVGARGDSMFFVIEGEVEIRLSDAQLEIAPSGSIFGEMALIDDSPRSATVIARTACRLLEINRRRFDFLAGCGKRVRAPRKRVYAEQRINNLRVLVSVEKEFFRNLLVSETPFFARAVMRVMADRLRRANARSSPA